MVCYLLLFCKRFYKPNSQILLKLLQCRTVRDFCFYLFIFILKEYELWCVLIQLLFIASFHWRWIFWLIFRDVNNLEKDESYSCNFEEATIWDVQDCQQMKMLNSLAVWYDLMVIIFLLRSLLEYSVSSFDL